MTEPGDRSDLAGVDIPRAYLESEGNTTHLPVVILRTGAEIAGVDLHPES
ncbi:MAG: hypothetical protein A4E39_00345 [Methanoregulaceae archaeon PtaB.Bin152]|nr:MAG: hypothetical protein A4E39_00345 [Methanoregulaceae archaeon PtaB.Bin152]